MRKVIGEEIVMMKQAYGDPRRTIIVDGTATATNAETFSMPQEDTWVTLTTSGKLGRAFEHTAPKVTGDMSEPPRFILDTDSSHILYLFTPKGTCSTVPVHQLPQINELEEGAPFHNVCSLTAEDEVVAVLSLPSSVETGFLFFVTEGGEVKRLRMEDLPGMMANVFAVMDVEQGDRLGWVMVTSGENEIALATAQAQAIRFKENDVRPTGLGAGGMRGVKLTQQLDRVVGAGIAEDHLSLWTVTGDGIAKSSPLAEYPTQGRAGSGVVTMKLPNDSLGLVAAVVGELDETIVVLTNKERAKSMRLGLAPQVKRPAKGDYVISVSGKEHVSEVVTFQKRIEIMETTPTPEPTPVGK